MQCAGKTTVRIRATFWGVFAVMVFSITSFALTGARIYARVSFFTGLIILVSYFWTFFALRGVSVRRSARFYRQQVGQIFEERFEILNDYPLAKLWLEVRDQSDLPAGAGSRVLTWIGPRQRRSYVGYSRLTHRGQYPLGPTLLVSGDPFGLFAAEKSFDSDRSLLVLPYMADLTHMPSPPGSLPGGRALRRRTLEVTPYAAGVREYAPGDSLNRVHWPTTARKDRMMVKEFDQDPQADIWIVLDAYRDAQLAQTNYTDVEKLDRHWLWRSQQKITLPVDTFEYAVSAAASMANYYIQLGRAVGLISAGRTFAVLPAERGERQLGKILEMLAYLMPGGTLQLMALVEVQATHLPRGSTIVIITPSLDKTVEVAASELQHRDLQPVVVLIDRISFNGFGDLDGVMLRLKTQRIPVAVIRRGDDLKDALEKGF